MGTQTDRRRYGGGKLAAAGKDEEITAANFSINTPSEDFTEIYPQRCFRGGRGWQITLLPPQHHHPPFSQNFQLVYRLHAAVLKTRSIHVIFNLFFFSGKLWKSDIFSHHRPNSWKIFISESSCQNRISWWEQWKCSLPSVATGFCWCCTHVPMTTTLCVWIIFFLRGEASNVTGSGDDVTYKAPKVVFTHHPSLPSTSLRPVTCTGWLCH